MAYSTHTSNTLILGFIAMLVFSGTVLARDTYDYDGSCPKSPNLVDKWEFYTCNCTSYAADKMNEHKVGLTNSYKLPKGKTWGNASNWINAAKQAGISYNSTPKHRDIAWFSNGHVAYVESVDSKGNITVSEYNYEYNYCKAYDYCTRSIKKGTSSYPKFFIHFGAK